MFTDNHRFQRKNAKLARNLDSKDTQRLCVIAVSLIVYRKASGAYNKAG